MVIEWALFWAWRNALTTDAAKRPLPKKRPWPAMIILPTDKKEVQPVDAAEVSIVNCGAAR